MTNPESRWICVSCAHTTRRDFTYHNGDSDDPNDACRECGGKESLFGWGHVRPKKRVTYYEAIIALTELRGEL